MEIKKNYIQQFINSEFIYLLTHQRRAYQLLLYGMLGVILHIPCRGTEKN